MTETRRLVLHFDQRFFKKPGVEMEGTPFLRHVFKIFQLQTGTFPDGSRELCCRNELIWGPFVGMVCMEKS